MSDVETLQSVLRVWKNAQAPMTKVIRWGNFPSYGQTLTEHSNSVLIVGDWVRSVVSGRFDDQIFNLCLRYHDHGEPLSGGDEHAGNKTKGKEVREWEGFRALTELVPEDLRTQMRRGFLLQFCRKTLDDEFELPERKTIRLLRHSCATEAAAFDFTERLDYLFSAYEGHCNGVRNESEGMLEHTLHRQSEPLDGLVYEYPFFAQIWGDELKKSLWNCIKT